MAGRFLRDIAGSVLVEYAVVFPLFMLVTLGTVEFTYMLYEWALANKATYVGARVAVVSKPVAQNITEDALLYDVSQLKQMGQYCFDLATGTGNGNCPPPTVKVDCTSSACTPDTFGFDSSAFTNANGTGIFDRMKVIFPRLQPDNVTISYQLNGSGYVGRPRGLPMNVTVSVQNVTHQFYFIAAILRFFGGGFASTPALPTFATTLTSEDMTTAVAQQTYSMIKAKLSSSCILAGSTETGADFLFKFLSLNSGSSGSLGSARISEKIDHE